MMQITFVNKVSNFFKLNWLQIFAVFSGSLIKLTTGIMIVWSSPSTPKLVNFTDEQIFMVTSLFNIGQLISIPLVALTVDRIGRKNGIVFCTLPLTFSWITMAISQTYEVLCFSRFIGGLGCGYGKTVISMYAVEISQAHYRGGMGTITSFMTRFGMLLVFSVGPYVTIPTMSLISSTFPILMFATFVWMPKSPYFLFLQGKPEEAKRSLTLLRGKHTDINEEFHNIQAHIAKRESYLAVFNKLIHNEVNRKAIFISIVINGIEQFSGMTVILAYSQDIFEAAGTALSPAICTIITMSVQTVVVGITIPFVDRFPRKRLMIISALGTGTSMAVISAYFYISFELKYYLPNLTFVPLAALLSYHIWSMVGISTLPTIMQNELFSTEVKTMGITLGAIFMQIMIVVVTKIFTVFSHLNLIYVTFGFFSVCCFSSILLTILFIPETRGLSLEEIQMLLQSLCKSKEIRSQVPKKDSKSSLST